MANYPNEWADRRRIIGELNAVQAEMPTSELADLLDIYIKVQKQNENDEAYGAVISQELAICRVLRK